MPEKRSQHREMRVNSHFIARSDGSFFGMDVSCRINRADGGTETVTLECRIDTLDEVEYYKAGGILQHVLANLARAA